MKMNIEKLLKNASNELATISDSPQLDAELLLSHLLSQPRTYFYTYPTYELNTKQLEEFNQYLKRRKNSEPIAYIIGCRSFWKFDLEVAPDVLIPRPETELLVELVLDKPLPVEAKIADLGTGSGAIAIAIGYEKPNWQIYATDVSQSALSIAAENAQQLGLDNIAFCAGNWCTALPMTDFDVIVSNPPYIAEKEWEAYAAGLKYEPKLALVSGADGLNAIKEIVDSARQYLKPGGFLLIEHGFAQGSAVRAVFEAFGYKDINTMTDLSGHERVTQGTSSLLK